MQTECPLCKKLEIEDYHKEKEGFKRLFYRCRDCLLIFLDPRLHLPKSIEKSRYELHNNSERADGYVKFLNTLLDPLKKYITPSMRGLDFGSGPYPMLCELMTEENYSIQGYDPYFKPDEALLRGTYDYITCCEVVEHFNYPGKDIKVLFDLVRPGGFIGIRTSLFENQIDFKDWHYIKDDTHISLYSKTSMNWIAENFDSEIKEIGSNVIIFQKNQRQIQP